MFLALRKEHFPEGIDLIMGHTECGNYSQLNAKAAEDCSNPGDIPEFIHAVKILKPRFFAMDNLPKSLIAIPMSEWKKQLKEYDIFPEWISNYNYGNLQKHRKRMFIIGARKEENFVFVPGETENITTVWDTISDLHRVKDSEEFSHVKIKGKSLQNSFKAVNKYKDVTTAEVAKMFLAWPTGKNLPYTNREGRDTLKVGHYRTHKDKYAHVLTGGDSTFHPVTGYPLTIRERARIQGCPDSFIFLGTRANLIKQTGKFMPVQFCEYLSRQIAAHVKGKKFKSSGKRILVPNSYIDQAKKDFCRLSGYSNQEKACQVCWIDNCNLKRREG